MATIKYYLREELVPAGVATSATQAEYDDHHLRRLRLARALIAVRGLSVSTTREVLRALDEHSTDLHLLFGLALGAVSTEEPDSPSDQPQEPTPADELISALGWEISEKAPTRATITDTLGTLRELGLPADWQTLVPYARLAEQTADLDLAQLEDADDPLERVERAVLLTILMEPVLLALRRMAQENESAKRHPRP
ncbi:DNA-binding transcriptional MerR regulator [Kitasatospora gansuensis]|uniref:DNA-binding transcriptional MerR regulator n=1 Tax=Kitasatospora gansuensis TaxID=258050 RepID=A0A7W7WKE1_9ACTN|nr:DNA-binding transcriptional MerR regulator [Kitasatospora gansuensis]